ncbi:MAG: DUF3604 domain-containing protein [Alkalispirochaeta sp.]
MDGTMYKLYFGETHDNTHQAPDPDFSMDDRLKNAAAHLDFYCGAYYPYTSPAFRTGGHPSEDTTQQPLNVERWKSPEQIDTEWTSVKDAIRRLHKEGSFVIFPGFEWQGDGSWGDHNVFFHDDDPPIIRVDTLEELYQNLRAHRAFAIPHHTAYIPGFRSKNWEVQDDTLSPFMEIYSIHGSSEGEPFGGGLRSNPFLGPDTSDGTYTRAIRDGRKLGVIGSTDNWGPLPGNYGRGLAAVWATELTRDALWDAFTARRVYGVSGDRITLRFEMDNRPMGSVAPLPAKAPVFRTRVDALDRIDYIDFVRDEVLLDRVSVLGESPSGLDLSDEFLFRIEYGWGPAANVLTLPPKEWNGAMRVAGGEIIDAFPGWISPGQSFSYNGKELTFRGVTVQDTVGRSVQNGFVVKIKGKKDAAVTIESDGITVTSTLQQMCAGSSVLWNRTSSAALIRDRFDTDAEALHRKDVLFGMAYKTKIHQALPSVVTSKDIAFTDTLYDGKPHSYRVRVRQRNGEMAWSSPIWVE